MNCQDLATVIVDAASGRFIDQPELDEMLAHTAACRECAVRLADQRTLSAGLGRLAALTRNERAPAGMEAALRAVYRERILTPAQAVSPLSPPPRRLRRWAFAAATAAAAILAVLALTSLLVAPINSNKQKPDDIEAHRTPGPQPTAPDRMDERQAPHEQKTVSHRSKPTRSLGNYQVEHRTQPGSRDESTRGTKEIATDFMPLSGSDLIPIDGGSVVRVELPRSALESFGLPMNMERAEERIKADVVVGTDGLARAIRFVR